jgi:cholesterol transport system auxiliary component
MSAVLVLAACSSVAPDKPVRATAYDFGPPPAAASTSGTRQPAIVLADPEAASSLETTALLYRLAYADPHQLLPYAHARWSAPPQRLVRQRLRDILGRDRAVLDQTESASLARTSGTLPRTLRIDVEEFSHVFESTTQSFGVVRMRATLTENTPAGERLVAQRVFDERVAAPTADAPGGVRALAAATDAAAQALTAWLAQPR